jgi:hypothetical protein
MRIRFVKNVVSAISMVVILAAAPAAFGRSTQPREREGIVATIRQLINRLTGGGVATNGTLSPPIPKNSTTPSEPSDGTTRNGTLSPPIPLDSN